MSGSHGSGAAPDCSAREFDLAHREWFSDGKCFKVMDRAAHYRDQAKHARRLADAAWQLDLADMLRRLAEDYDERAECVETGTPEIRHAELLDE